MSRRAARLRRAAGLVAAAIMFGACAGQTAAPGPGGTGAPATAGPGGSTPGTVAPTANGRTWAVYGHDDANTRTNTAEARVSAASVARLAPVWQKNGMVGVTGTPVVVDGVAYFSDWKGVLHAVRAENGDELWVATVGGSVVGSPAVDGDAVYASSGANLFKFDIATGEERWKVVTHDHPQAQISSSPIVVDDLVIQGIASFENILKKDVYTFRGAVAAYDVSTGAPRWRFDTTAGDATSGPGAGVWGTPAVDRDLGLIFVGTGQSLAPPTAPLTDSLLAIDYETGELRWSKQFTYPDVFSSGNPGGKDADVGASPNLWTAGGRALVGAGDKGGTFHTLDRATGEVVWETELTPGSVFGGQIGSAALVDGHLIATSNVGDPDTNAPTDTTQVFSLDPATGEIEWSSDALPGKIFGPVSAVPGIAFVGTDRGKMSAYAVGSGEELWSFDAPGKVGGGPAIVDGRVLWGYGFVLFQGAGDGGIISFEVVP